MSIEPHLWNALAGSAAIGRVPTQGSDVLFFPHGYAGESSPQALHLSAAHICRVSSLRLLADPDTDEVFAIIGLIPRPITDPFHHQYGWTPVARSSSTSSASAIADADRVGEFTTYTKILVKSDVTNRNGLSLSKSGMLAVFPPVPDVNRVMPAENVFALDVHGRAWKFSLVLTGNPPRYRLNKWSKFATEKRLVEGDIVIFARHRTGDLYIGIRRTRNSSDATRRANMQVDSIAKATQLAREGLPFEVSYYPWEVSPEHVVTAVPVPVQVLSSGGAAGASPSSGKDNYSKGKHVQGVSEVHDSNRERGSRQSSGASTTKSFKLFGHYIQ